MERVKKIKLSPTSTKKFNLGGFYDEVLSL
jgi:hypothetical protein